MTLLTGQQMCHIALETHENNLEVVRQARQTIAVMGTPASSVDVKETALPSHRPRSKRKPTLLRPVGSDLPGQLGGGGLKRDNGSHRR